MAGETAAENSPEKTIPANSGQGEPEKKEGEDPAVSSTTEEIKDEKSWMQDSLKALAETSKSMAQTAKALAESTAAMRPKTPESSPEPAQKPETNSGGSESSTLAPVNPESEAAHAKAMPSAKPKESPEAKPPAKKEVEKPLRKIRRL